MTRMDHLDDRNMGKRVADARGEGVSQDRRAFATIAPAKGGDSDASGARPGHDDGGRRLEAAPSEAFLKLARAI